jgi:hypothetical protein
MPSSLSFTIPLGCHRLPCQSSSHIVRRGSACPTERCRSSNSGRTIIVATENTAIGSYLTPPIRPQEAFCPQDDPRDVPNQSELMAGSLGASAPSSSSSSRPERSRCSFVQFSQLKLSSLPRRVLQNQWLIERLSISSLPPFESGVLCSIVAAEGLTCLLQTKQGTIPSFCLLRYL